MRSQAFFTSNTDYVKPGELAKAADLLQPKWRGKISTEDPTSAGSGSDTSARIYVQMGEDFIKGLYIPPKPVITRARRHLTDGAARGTYRLPSSTQRRDVCRTTRGGVPRNED